MFLRLASAAWQRSMPSSAGLMMVAAEGGESLTPVQQMTGSRRWVNRGAKKVFDPDNYGMTTTATKEGFSMADSVTPANPGKRWGMYQKPVDYSDAIKHRTLVALDKHTITPHVSTAAFVHPSATLVGNVELWDYSNVWEEVVIRGDLHLVRVGQFTSIGARSVIDESFVPLGPDHTGSTIIGHYVVIENNCHIRAATIHDTCLIGARSVVLDGATIGTGCIIEPDSVVQPFTDIPAGEVWGGNPAVYIRDVLPEDEEEIVRRGILAERKTQRVIQEFYYPWIHLWRRFVKPDDDLIAEAEALKRKGPPPSDHHHH